MCDPQYLVLWLVLDFSCKDCHWVLLGLFVHATAHLCPAEVGWLCHLQPG